mmetsp:Transcript_35841/g.76464  ORF Transcript_35841/g.76464 Transcript_35841/m.76464 type:complete len:101 (-) Transcript_35841:2935-3237(-)
MGALLTLRRLLPTSLPLRLGPKRFFSRPSSVVGASLLGGVVEVVCSIGCRQVGLGVRAPEVRSDAKVEAVKLKEWGLTFLHVGIAIRCARQFAIEEPPGV